LPALFQTPPKYFSLKADYLIEGQHLKILQHPYRSRDGHHQPSLIHGQFSSAKMGPIKHKALINVDLGEGFGNWTITSDEDLLPFIDHANIACGFHASYVFLFSLHTTASIATPYRLQRILCKTIARA
jgi:hypothetical protein